jgi:hypothetical protein
MEMIRPGDQPAPPSRHSRHHYHRDSPGFQASWSRPLALVAHQINTGWISIRSSCRGSWWVCLCDQLVNIRILFVLVWVVKGRRGLACDCSAMNTTAPRNADHPAAARGPHRGAVRPAPSRDHHWVPVRPDAAVSASTSADPTACKSIKGTSIQRNAIATPVPLTPARQTPRHRIHAHNTPEMTSKARETTLMTLVAAASKVG